MQSRGLHSPVLAESYAHRVGRQLAAGDALAAAAEAEPVQLVVAVAQHLPAYSLLASCPTKHAPAQQCNTVWVLRLGRTSGGKVYMAAQTRCTLDEDPGVDAVHARKKRTAGNDYCYAAELMLHAEALRQPMECTALQAITR